MIICYTIATYGLSNLLVYGSGPYNILGKIRMVCDRFFPVLGKMLDCMMCTSCNIGIVLSIVNLLGLTSFQFTPFNALFGGDNLSIFTNVLIVLMDAAYTSGSVWLIHTIQEMIESKTNS